MANSFASSVVLYVYDSIKLEKNLTSDDEDIINITSLVEGTYLYLLLASFSERIFKCQLKTKMES